MCHRSCQEGTLLIENNLQGRLYYYIYVCMMSACILQTGLSSCPSFLQLDRSINFHETTQDDWLLGLIMHSWIFQWKTSHVHLAGRGHWTLFSTALTMCIPVVFILSTYTAWWLVIKLYRMIFYYFCHFLVTVPMLRNYLLGDIVNNNPFAKTTTDKKNHTICRCTWDTSKP